MKRLPKHLRDMPAESLASITKGSNRFRFGFAEPGERINDAEFVGNFATKKAADAKAAEIAANGGITRGNAYLHGRLPRGWAVWKVVQP